MSKDSRTYDFAMMKVYVEYRRVWRDTFKLGHSVSDRRATRLLMRGNKASQSFVQSSNL